MQGEPRHKEKQNPRAKIQLFDWLVYARKPFAKLIWFFDVFTITNYEPTDNLHHFELENLIYQGPRNSLEFFI